MNGYAPHPTHKTHKSTAPDRIMGGIKTRYTAPPRWVGLQLARRWYYGTLYCKGF
jgi:hypothetical protein